MEEMLAYRFDRARYDERMKWYLHDRFGMFIHFGLYSIPARGDGVQAEVDEHSEAVVQIPLHTLVVPSAVEPVRQHFLHLVDLTVMTGMEKRFPRRERSISSA